MRDSIDHATCSQLLRAFLRGNAGPDASSVEAHLQSCRQCRAERDIVEMLLTPVEPLTEAERARIHASVRAETGAGLAQTDSVVLSRSRRTFPMDRNPVGNARAQSRRAWLAPALSAAAIVLLIVSGIVVASHFGSLKEADSLSAGGGAARGGAVQAPRDAERSGLTPHVFALAPLRGLREVERRANSALVRLRLSSGRQQVVDQSAPALLRRVAEEAPPALRRQLLRCGRKAVSRDASLVPAYGAAVTIRAMPALALVFAAAVSPDQPVERFELFAWPLGSCQPLLHRSGPIRG
jgi:hypothetical protein